MLRARLSLLTNTTLPRIICTQVITLTIISQWRQADSTKESSEVLTVLDWAQEAGMMTGLVSTTRVTHATPAALYAKTASREWECDSASPAGVEDIAWQLVESARGRNISLVLGGGRASFTPTSHISHLSRETLEKFNCSRRDNVDLVARWQSLHPGGKFVSSKSDLLRVDPSETDSLLGENCQGRAGQ